MTDRIIHCDCGLKYIYKDRHKHYKTEIHKIYLLQLRLEYQRISLLSEQKQ